MNKTYILLHDGLITAVYTHKSDLVESLKHLLNIHNGRIGGLRKYSVHELTEQVENCGVFLAPKSIPVERLVQETVNEK